MMHAYIDSSTLVKLAIEGDKKTKDLVKALQPFKNLLSSELSLVECQSGLTFQFAAHREKLLLSEQQMSRVFETINLITISSDILAHARRLIRNYRATLGLRSLDAIHIASALVFADRTPPTDHIEFFTSDRRQFQCWIEEGRPGHLV